MPGVVSKISSSVSPTAAVRSSEAASGSWTFT
jgi:hypothetical protein